MVSRLAYRDQIRIFLDQANEELAKGDLRQASEKGWGAAAQMIKAVASEKGWDHNGHWQLHGVVSQLVLETGDDELRTLFAVTNHLHINFYEGWLTSEFVRRAIQDVAKFVEKLESLLNRR